MSGVDKADSPAPLLQDRGGGVAVGFPIAVPVTDGHRGHWKYNLFIEYFHSFILGGETTQLIQLQSGMHFDLIYPTLSKQNILETI